MQRLGFFGGCFNPPTIAHYELALKAVDIAKLDKLYFVPMGDFYPKKDLISAKYRYEMLKLMVCNSSKLDVSKIQMEQEKNIKAIDTFKLINKKYNNSKNYFIMGSDNFEKIGTWKNSEELLKEYDYIILSRGNFIKDNCIVVDSIDELKNISSSLVRNNILNKKSIHNLVTNSVEEYIVEKGLYK